MVWDDLKRVLVGALRECENHPIECNLIMNKLWMCMSMILTMCFFLFMVKCLYKLRTCGPLQVLCVVAQLFGVHSILQMKYGFGMKDYGCYTSVFTNLS